MNIFKNRPLICITTAFLAPLALLSYVSSDERPFLVLVFIIAQLMLALTVFSVKLIKRIPFTPEFILALICLIISVLSSVIPLFMFNYKNADALTLDNKTVRICGYVTKLNKEESNYASFIAKIYEADNKNVDFSVSAFTKFSPQLSEGDVFKCDALLTSSDLTVYYSENMLKRHNILFNATIESDNYFEICGTRKNLLTYFSSVADKIGFKFKRTFSRDTASLAKALLLGDRYELSDVTVRDFRRSGISHILALSGMHLALISGFFMYFLKFFILSDKLRFICVALISLLTMLFTGASPSILRAGLMLIYYQAGYILKKRSDIITALFSTTSLIVIFDPYMILDTGLTLSFAATFGIALFSNISRNITLKIFANPTELSLFQKIFKYCVDSLVLSFCAGVFVTVASVFIFDSVSLISAISTLIFSPLIIAFMLLSALTLIFSHFQWVSAFLCKLSEFFADTIIKLASYFSHKDKIVISSDFGIIKFLAFVFLLLFLFAVAKNMSVKNFAVTSLCFMCVSLSCAALCLYYPYTSTHVQLISDQSNDAIAISDSHNTTYIDISGATSYMCVCAADAVCLLRDTDIDEYILTHYHFDHISALKKINSYVLIRKLLLPYPENDTDKEYAAELEDVAKHLQIDVKYYPPSEVLELGNINFTPFALERISPYSHPRIAFSLEKSDKCIVYCAAYDENCESYTLLQQELSNADYLIKSVHGPSVDDTDTLLSLIPYNCKFLIRPVHTNTSQMLLKQTLTNYGRTEIVSFNP